MTFNKLILSAFFVVPVTSAATVGEQLHDGWNNPELIFSQHDKTTTNTYRIPAITATTNGTVIVVTDARADGTSDIGLNTEVHFGYRVSFDAGSTWSRQREIIPDISGKKQISDPAIVHIPETGSTFLFGFYNDKFITRKPVSENSDFFMFTSDDGGTTWDKGVSLYKLVPQGYKYILQGPGSGMHYNGITYLAVQAWHSEKDNSLGGTTATSGFIYSADNGKTWNSAWLRPVGEIQGAPGTDALPDITSESSIFHHAGYIYLAAKPETSREAKSRVVYRTKDNGQNWERVEESFLPDNLARAESSSISLDDKVYLVGYSIKTERAARDSVYISTNTGRTIQAFDSPVNGYTSLAQDADNIYLFFEGQGDMYFSRYDIASKDYANLNATILNRSDDLFYIQNKLTGNSSYIKGSYGKNDTLGAELLYATHGIKLGLFHSQQSDNSKHAYKTISYSTKDTTFSLAKSHLAFSNDNLFFGYQVSNINYANKSYNDAGSWLLGYSLSYNINSLNYGLDINGVYSNNKFSRNNAEGLGRKARFNSYSLAIKSSLSKNINFTPSFYANIDSGLITTFFNHAPFTENGGNGWNNVSLSSSVNWSNQLFANIQISKYLPVFQATSLILTAKITYQYELMNSDLWAENYTVLDAHRTMTPPVKKYDGGLTSGFVEASFNINKKTNIVAAASLNTAGDRYIGGTVTYSF